MMNFRAMLAAAGSAGGGVVDWSLYDATGDKTPVEFSSSAVTYNNVVAIDETRALVVYSGASSYCRARIATLNGSGTVSFGTESVILSAAITGCGADLLDSTHAIIVVESGGDVKAIAIDFSGTTIGTVGSAVSTETVNAATLRVAALGSAAFMVVYEDLGDTNLTAYYGTVSGTTVTMGNGLDFETKDPNDVQIVGIDSTSAFVLAGHTSTGDCEAYLMGVSGTTPTEDSTVRVLNGSYTVSRVAIGKISSTQFVCAYNETFSKTNIEAAVVTNNSGTLEVASTVEISTDNAKAEGLTIAMPDAEHAVVTIAVGTTEMQTTVVEVSGKTLTPLTNYQNLTGDKEFLASAAVGTDWVLVMYEDDNDSSKGKGIVLGV